MTGKISPSIMCIDYGYIADRIHLLEQAGVDYLHCDVMDGSFVPNFALGPDLLAAVRRMTKIPLDIHFMVQNPENHIATFQPQPGDIVTVHQEATIHLQRTLQIIRNLGAMPGVALNPATPIASLEHVLDDVAVVVIMTVNPGFAGQKLIPATLPKIRLMKEYLHKYSYDDILIEVDGNVSFENAIKMRQAGADIFVAGTSSVFAKDLSILEGVEKLRLCIA